MSEKVYQSKDNANSYERRMNPEEIAEHFGTKIEEKCSPVDWKKQDFIKWFIPRIKKVGVNFDYRLTHRCFEIWKSLQKKNDHFTLIVGKEGVGKTTLATQMCALISPDMDMEDICYTPDQYLTKLREVATEFDTHKYKVDDRSILIDEGGIGLFSRESMMKSNRDLNKTFMVQRFLQLNVAICIPNYWSMDQIVRNHRTKTLIVVPSRGSYRCITGKGIDIVNYTINKGLPLMNIKLPYHVWWYGHFSKAFPKTLADKGYDAYKLKHIQSFLENTKAGTAEAQKELVTLKEASLKIGLAPATIRNYVNANLIPAVKIGQKHYMHIDIVNKIQKKGLKEMLPSWRTKGRNETGNPDNLPDIGHISSG